MVCAPVRSIIPSLKLGDYLSVQAHKSCPISHMCWRNAFAILGVSGLFCRFYSIFDGKPC